MLLRDQHSDQRGRAHVQQTDHDTHEEHENEHDDGIGDQLFLAGPGDLLQLIVHVLEGLGDPLGQVFEPAEDFAQLALSLPCIPTSALLSPEIDDRNSNMEADTLAPP